MKVALIAEVHGNAMALEAVFESIASEKPDSVVCLGDVMGLFNHPSDCLHRVGDRCQVFVAGDQEFLIAQKRVDSLGGDDSERAALRWTAERLTDAEVAYLQQLPVQIDFETGFSVVHGAFAAGEWLRGRIVPSTLEANLESIRDSDGPAVGVFGNSPRPFFGWLHEQRASWAYLHEGEIHWPQDADAVVFAPGSVGQPEPGDPRASWGLLDLERRSFTIRRVGYDLDAAARSCLESEIPAAISRRLQLQAAFQ